MRFIASKKPKSTLVIPKTIKTMNKYLSDPNLPYPVILFSLLFEVFVGIFIIERVKYTEIDWLAYMQEVEGFLNGTLNYTLLKGDTGPLVYPAGFVYVFSFLYKITDNGRNVHLAQYIFLIILECTMALVYLIYAKSRTVPPYFLALMSLSSYRIHSIFLLRLFNDCITMLFLYMALYLMLNDKWFHAAVAFSISVSIKMNALLFAPAVSLIFLHTNGLIKTVLLLSMCALLQVIFGLPFLFTDAVSYMMRSFDFGRQFMYKWTVNWRFFPEWIFLSRPFHIVLLLLHIVTLLFFILIVWPRFTRNSRWCSDGHRLPINTIIMMMFQSNFIGIVFSRSLHYQFYCWYYHTLPFLLFNGTIKTPFRLLIFGLIEMCWNVYPSTVFSSVTLFLCHLIILFTNFFSAIRQWRYHIKSKNL